MYGNEIRNVLYKCHIRVSQPKQFFKKVKVLVFSLNLGVQLSNVSEMSSSSFICVTDAAISI